MKIVEFDSEIAAESFQQKAWIETVKEAVRNGGTAQNIGGDHITDITALSDQEIADLKICGHVNGNVRLDNGSTSDYANVQKAYELEKWYVPAPIGLIDLTEYSVIDLPENWTPPAGE